MDVDTLKKLGFSKEFIDCFEKRGKYVSYKNISSNMNSEPIISKVGNDWVVSTGTTDMNSIIV